MVEAQRLVQVGTVDPTGTPVPVLADVTVIGDVQAVLLSKAYQMLDPSGWPNRPEYLGTITPQKLSTITSGTTIKVFACEAAAIVAANGGSYAS